MKALALYWHTLRHLRPVQFYGRVWFRLHRPRADASAAPPLRAPDAPWTPPARREPSLLAPEVFSFLGQAGPLRDVGWDGPARDKLWRYNQHYFDDLNAEGAEDRTAWHRELLANWVAANPPGRGNGWEPYPTSLRIVNWIKWSLAGHALSGECRHSLAIQARWLARRREVHLLGNHLFANAKALVFAGLFFEGEEARRWLSLGLRILRHELPEQVLADGGHFERSTMYHALAFEDVLDLCNLFTAHRAHLSREAQEVAALCREHAGPMQAWLRTMEHPDGDISFFNDAALGIAPSCQQLHAYAHRLGLGDAGAAAVPARWLADSGYARLALGPAVALLDLAPVGPDYLPGHAHADTLSFELSLAGQRVLVNSGTSCYGSGPERQRQRGTAAHNTVCINGEDSSEIWAGFRVARRAYPVAPKVQLDREPMSAECAHDGYTRLAQGLLHHRRWELRRDGMRIEDRIGATALPAVARFHFHPDVRLTHDPGTARGRARLPSGHEIRWTIVQGAGRVEPGTWHPRFGVAQANTCLAVELVAGQSVLALDWDPLPS